MTAIYFHSTEDTVAIRGAERAHFSVFCGDLSWSIIRHTAEEWSDFPAPLRKAFPSSHPVHKSRDFQRDAKLYLTSSFFDSELLFTDPFEMSLNTAFRLGSDPVRLGARLHGQCEIHAYVEGWNRAWLADIIREGRQVGFYREGMGWKRLIDFLLSSDYNPIVTSYSVTESFPNQHVAAYDPPFLDDGVPDYDAWYDLSNEVQWDLAMKGLRAEEGGLELDPGSWDDFYFGDGLDANGFVARLEDA